MTAHNDSDSASEPRWGETPSSPFQSLERAKELSEKTKLDHVLDLEINKAKRFR